MAGPLGYPDYQRLDNVDSPTLVTEAQKGRVAVQTGGDLDVSRYTHLRMRIIPDQKGSYLFVKFLWKRVRNGGEIEGEREIAISPLGAGPEGELMFSVPNLGPFVTWEVGEMTKGLKEWLSEWRIAADNRPVGLECPIAGPLLIPRTEVKIGAGGGTVNLLPRYYYAGPVQMGIVNMPTVGCSQQIEVRDPVTNAWVVSQEWFAKTATAEVVPAVVPLGAWRLSVTNASGAEQRFFPSMQPSPTGAL